MTIPTGYGQASFIFSGSGVPLGAATTVGFKNNSALTVAQIADEFRDAWITNVQPVLVQNTGLDHVLIKLGPDSTGPTAIATSGVAGGDTSAQAPPNVAYLVHKNTNLGGRKGRGRMYIPGVDETEVLQNGTINSGTVTALEGAFNDFFTDMDALDLPLYLLHSDGTTPTAITELDVSTTVATQRRRLRK